MKFKLGNHKITTHDLNGSKIYTIENFYENPEEVLGFFKSKEAGFHKSDTYNSFNRIMFEDRRHRFYFEDFELVEYYVASIVNQIPKNKGLLLSNQFQFKNRPFNDYKNKYWIPHTDFGYNAIVYFDDSETNLYKQLLDHDFNKLPEHQVCWVDKKYYEIIHTIKGSYNTCIAFDGTIPHGQNIDSDKFIKEKRLTQPIFFKN